MTISSRTPEAADGVAVSARAAAGTTPAQLSNIALRIQEFTRFPLDLRAFPNCWREPEITHRHFEARPMRIAVSRRSKRVPYGGTITILAHAIRVVSKQRASNRIRLCGAVQRGGQVTRKLLWRHGKPHASLIWNRRSGNQRQILQCSEARSLRLRKRCVASNG
jgi:hypothetical protein